MALVTGVPLGNVDSQDDIYIEGAPYIYFQDYTADELFNPDGDNYYYGLSGTTTYPVFNLGCVTDVSLTENVTMNDVRCDSEGTKDTVQRREYLEFVFTLSTLLPLSTLRHILNAAAVTVSGDIEKMGIGSINNNARFHVYCPKVYDEDTGDWLSITLHKAKFVDAFTINMQSGQPWTVTGIKLRAHVDSTKPAGQEFATIIRADPSAI